MTSSEYFSLDRILLPKAHVVQSRVGKSSTSSHRRERAGMTQLLSHLELSAKALLPGQIGSPTELSIFFKGWGHTSSG